MESIGGIVQFEETQTKLFVPQFLRSTRKINSVKQYTCLVCCRARAIGRQDIEGKKLRDLVRMQCSCKRYGVMYRILDGFALGF